MCVPSAKCPAPTAGHCNRNAPRKVQYSTVARAAELTERGEVQYHEASVEAVRLMVTRNGFASRPLFCGASWLHAKVGSLTAAYDKMASCTRDLDLTTSWTLLVGSYKQVIGSHATSPGDVGMMFVDLLQASAAVCAELDLVGRSIYMLGSKGVAKGRPAGGKARNVSLDAALRKLARHDGTSEAAAKLLPLARAVSRTDVEGVQPLLALTDQPAPSADEPLPIEPLPIADEPPSHSPTADEALPLADEPLSGVWVGAVLLC